MTSRKRNLLFAAALILFAAAFILIYMAKLGNTNQIYEDIVAECTAVFSSNKSAERSLVYILIGLGIVACTLYYFATRKMQDVKSELLSNQSAKELLVFLLTLVVANFIVYGFAYPVIVIAIVYMALVAVIDKELVLDAAVVYFLGVYTYVGIYRLYAYFGGLGSGNLMTGAVFSIIISLLPLLFKEKQKAMRHLSLIDGLVTPFAMLIFFSNLYLKNDEYITIDVPDAVKRLISILLAIFVAEAAIRLISKWKDDSETGKCVNVGTCISIMAFNSYEGSGAIMPADIHHPFENIIGYSQIFELGQTPFSEYVPVSGMYSVFHGAIFSLFGDGGLFSNYYVSDNVFYLIAIILIVLLLKSQLDGALMLFISLLCSIAHYDRVLFILPIMLLLINPKLQSKRNFWLMAWFLTSLFLGLYYPLYGVAVCASMMPLAIYQIVNFVKEGELAKSVRTVRFWIGWAVCFGIAIMCIPLLLGTLRHMLAMSGQSILADGISRFGQVIPDGFFSYLMTNYPVVRLCLYLLLTFLFPAMVVWISYMLSIKTGGVKIAGKRIEITNPQQFVSFIAIAIMLCISYSYTVVRLDIGTIYARSGYVIAGIMIIFIVLTLRHIQDGVARLILLAFTAVVLCLEAKVGIYNIESSSKLTAYYTVPENYIYVTDDAIEKIGEGFISQNIYDSIQYYYERFADRDKEISYYGDPSNFGSFYLLDIKGDVAMESGTAESYDAAQEAVDIIRENDSIVGNPWPYYQYYLYDYLMTSGEYYWDEEAGDFIPNSGLYSLEEVQELNRANPNNCSEGELGKIASSWGLSMNTLKQIMDEVDIVDDVSSDGTTATVNFTSSISGEEADFMYLEFEGMGENFQYVLFDLLGEYPQESDGLRKYFMKKDYNPGMVVQVSWLNESGERCSISCNMSEGKLLIPLGAGVDWLLENHDSLTVTVYQDGNLIATPEIKDVQLYEIQNIK